MQEIQYLSVLIQEYYQLPSKVAWMKLRKEYKEITGKELPYPLYDYVAILETLELYFEARLQEEKATEFDYKNKLRELA